MMDALRFLWWSWRPTLRLRIQRRLWHFVAGMPPEIQRHFRAGSNWREMTPTEQRFARFKGIGP